jgi:hypothetical protein
MELRKLWGTTANDGPAVVPQAPNLLLNQSHVSLTLNSSSLILLLALQTPCTVHIKDNPPMPSELSSYITQTNTVSVSTPLITDPPPLSTDVVTTTGNLWPDTNLVVPSIILSNPITDIYLLDASGQAIRAQTSNPFITVPQLHGPQGERIRILAIVNNGAMINAIDTAAHQQISRRLSLLSPSSRTLRMADGSLVPSTGVWSGTIFWGPISVQTLFKVFPSRGLWQMLIGKPLLEQVQAIHDYSSDAILLPHGNSLHQISNFTEYRPLPTPCLPTAIRFPSTTTFNQSVSSPVSILTQNYNNNNNIVPNVPTIPLPIDIHKRELIANILPNQLPIIIPVQAIRTGPEVEEGPQPTFEIEDAGQSITIGEVLDLPTSILPKDIFTRLTKHGPFWPMQVEVVVEAVHYGDQLTEGQ